MISYFGSVKPDQTDIMGHFSAQHYAEAFDQATWCFMSALGYRASDIKDHGEGWADVRHLTTFHKELLAGDSFHIDTRIIKVGQSSINLFHELRNQSGEVAAAMDITSVYFDVRNRRSVAIPEPIKLAALLREQAEAGHDPV